MRALKVLLADNDCDFRQSLRIFLEIKGFIVQEAASVGEALQILEHMGVDTVLSDLRMEDDDNGSDISGLEIARMANKKQILCLILTAFPTIETTRLALRALGAKPLAVDYIPKANGPEAVLQAINRFRGLSILHLSDLHPRLTSEGCMLYDLERACDEFLEDVTSWQGLALNPLQAIVLSGDISHQCRPENFRLAWEILERFSRQLDIPLDHFVLSPGNHDIDRVRAKAVSNTLLSMREGNSAWFDKFKAYLEFTRYFYDNEEAFSPDHLYRIFVFENRVAVVAFNSCVVEGDAVHVCQACNGKEHYHGWIDTRQVRDAGEELNQFHWDGLRIGTFHHHIRQENQSKRKNRCQGDHLWNYHVNDHLLKFTFSENGFRILLHGHQHKVELKQTETLGTNVPYNFGSGTFWLTTRDEQQAANYLLLGLSPVQGASHVVMRKYQPSTLDRPGHWAQDDSIRPEGIIPLPNIVIPANDSF